MKPRTIMRGKRITQYFLIILLIAMLFNMVTGGIELYGDAAANHEWYWAIIGVGAIYALPILLLFILFMFFRYRVKKLQSGKPYYRNE